MRPVMYLIVSMIALASGCATPPPAPTQGNFAAAPSGFDRRMARDTLQQLAALFPPASTRFNLTHLASDEFGAALLKGLRDKGYAVSEPAPAPAGAKAPAGPQLPSTGVPLGYVIDRPATGLYRVAVTVGKSTLTRAYAANGDALAAAGSWARKD